MTDLDKIIQEPEVPYFFEVGDTVLLKSGSHPMVVTDLPQGMDPFICCWMSPDGTLHSGRFHYEVLQLADTNEKYSLQKQLDLLNLQLNLQKLEGFKDQLKKERMNLAAPSSDRFPRKIR